jgi:hypothetical protein
MRSPCEHLAHVLDGAHAAAHGACHLGLSDTRQVGHSTSDTRQPAAGAFMTISRGYPNLRSARLRLSSASRPAARIGPRSRIPSPVRRRTRRASSQLPAAPAAARRLAAGCGGGPGPGRRSPPAGRRGRPPRTPGRLGHDRRAERPRDLTRPVGGAVVDDDRPEAGRHPLEHPRQCQRLIQARQDHVNDHGCAVPPELAADRSW